MTELCPVCQHQRRRAPHSVALPPKPCFLDDGSARFPGRYVPVESLAIQPGLLGDLAQDIPASDVAPFREKGTPHPQVVVGEGLLPLTGGTPGRLKGRLVVGPEFFEPLPEEVLELWEGR